MTPRVRQATTGDVAELAGLAGRTFALACPPDALAENIAAHVAEHLSPERFSEYLDDPERELAVAEEDGRLIGYTMLVFSAPPVEIAAQLSAPATPELSKIYVDEGRHGSGAGAALIDDAVSRVGAAGRSAVWLGTNEANQRAQRFYAKHGFRRVGSRRFLVGDRWEHDAVFERVLEPAG